MHESVASPSVASPARLLDRVARHPSTPWLIVGASLLTCVLGWYLGDRTVRQRAEQRFTRDVDATVQRLVERLADYEDTLRATAAFVRTTPEVSRDVWRLYVSSLALRDALPGVAALGFSPRVPDPMLPAHVERQRRAGATTYQVWPTGRRDEHFPITYLEPESDVTARIIGFDLASDAARLRELERTRDAGGALLLGGVRLRRSPREGDSAAFALMLPVYDPRLPVALPEQRRQALIGFVYAPFKLSDFFRGATDAAASGLGVAVHAGRPDGALLYQQPVNATDAGVPTFRAARTITAAGQPWTVVFGASTSYLTPAERLTPALVVAAAVLTNLALAALLVVQRSAGRRAEVLAAQRWVDLHRSESAFQAVAESARVAIVTTDDTGRFRYANAAAERMLGATRDQLRGVDCAAYVADADRERLVLGLGRFVAGEGRISSGAAIPLRGRRRSGEEFPAEISLAWVDSPEGRLITGVIADLSERERAEANARVAEERWKVALESTDDGVWDWDVPQQVLHGSQRLFELLGLGMGRRIIAVEDWDALVHPDDAARRQEELQAHLAGTLDRYVSEYRVQLRDGTCRWLLARGRVIARDADGRPLRVVGTCSDITDRHTAQQALEFARQQAERAARSKTDFLAMMSHELRTPMNGVLGMANLLGSTPLSGEQHEYLDMIARSGRALLRLIDDILDFSKIEAGRVVLEQVPCELGAIVREVVTMLGVQARTRGLTIESTVAPGTPTGIVSDPGRLRQVLFNLVGNAIKFTEVGSVHVRVGCDGVQGGRATLRVTVADTGIGIPEDKQRLLFEKFTQADPSTSRRFGGTGLGLAISKGLVESLGGTIGVSSTVGVGSQFWFTVTAPVNGQVVEAPPIEARTQAIDVPGPDADARRVLVAEDNAVNQRVAVRMLEKLGYVADVAEDGQQALAMALQTSYAAILMDCHMPRMDGFEATRAIRAALPMEQRPPILALTAAGTDADRERCRAAGMDDFLGKPVHMPELREMLARWLPPPTRSQAS